MPGLVVGDDVEELAISLRAKSSRPIVHIELGDQNDYLSRRRNDLRNELGLFGQIEASSVRVVELESRGTRVRNTKRFHVINPTSNSYEFSWVPMGNPSPAWRCTTSKGMILAGKRGEMVFEYTPDEVGVAESFYKFKITGTSVDELFLFTGSVVEPVVAFDRQRLDFGAQLLGGVLTDTIHIVNDENLPFSFNFDAMSMGGAGDVFPGFRHPVLELIPMSGLVPPNGRIPIVVNFSPAEEKFHNFNLVCHARKKPNQLNLNVKGEGYAVHTKLLLTEESGGSDGDGEREMVESRRGVNYVDFGHVHLNEKLVKNLSISNTGKFNVDYSWTKSKNNPMLKINGCKSSGSLRKGEKLDLELEFSPVTETSLEGIVLTCTIAGRYDYVFQIGGSGVRPNLHFSFIDFDFGARFITAPGATLEAAESVMLVTNRDLENSLSIDSAFVSQRALRIESKPTVLEPGEALEIPFLFAPREAKDYEFDVPFLVNGTSKQNVKIKGKGVYARLDLVDLHQSHLQFGSIVEGNTVSRNVKVVNKSSAELTFNIVDEDKVGFGKGKLEYNDIIYFPAGPVVLGPHESCVINLTFSPEKRLMNFTEDLLVRYAGETRKLLSMSGAATGFEVMLETDALPFGVVMAGSMRTRKLNFENSGDMPARCKWLEGTFGENFSISPVEANVPPGSEFAFDVCFSPTYIDDDVRQEGIKLLVDGSDPLTLTCTGSCVPQPEDTIKTMSFSSCARKESVQSISISNPTDKVWTLTPVIKGIHWFGMDEISVPGKGSVDYNLTYYPLSMTTAQGGDGDGDGPAGEEKHKGSLFFALPNGSALLYNLEGDSSEPEPESRGSHNTVAKTMLTIPLPVKNWLRSPQKFKVDVTLADEAEGSSTFLEGANQIDVPSMATRDYPLRFFSYKEGLRAAVVKFTNVVTGEYLFHEIAVQVGPSEVQDTFKLEAPVRQVAKKILNIDNPLGSEDAVTFGEDWWKCDNECVRLTQIGSMAGSKEGTFEIEYRPLVTTVGVEKASLTFQIEELGDYKFELELLAMPASAQYQLRFECPLGSKQTETFTFKGFNKSGCDFDNTVDKPEFFTVDKSLKAPPSENVWDGQDLRLGVSFEPSSIGEVRDTLRVKSKDYGDYSCTLIGVCTPALPQGPFLLPNGGSKDVEFRNVFGTAMDFSCVTDDPRFTVSAGVVNIPARTSKGVQVKYVKEEGQKGKAKAKLSIRCKDRPDVPAWIFYLTGEEE
jgi:hydrocephalus-inducing protein